MILSMGLKRRVKIVPRTVVPKDVLVSKSPFPTKRACTDLSCLLLLFIFLVVLSCLLAYCIKFGDIARITVGYDRCGNICGRVTERIRIAPYDSKISCLGADWTARRYLLVRGAGVRVQNNANVNRECVTSCDSNADFRQFRFRCIPQKINQRQAPYRHQDHGNSSGGSVGQSGGGVGVLPEQPLEQPLVEIVPEEQRRRNVSVPLLTKPPILIKTNNKKKGIPDRLMLPPYKVNRTRRDAVEAVYRRHLLQYRERPLDPGERIDVHFSKTGYQNFFHEVAEDLELCWKELLTLFFIALGFTMVIMLFLILAVEVVVILSVSVGIIVSLFAAIFLWAKWGYELVRLTAEYRFNPYSMSEIENRFVDSYLGYAIVVTIIFGILFFVLFVTRRRLFLVIRLFKESGRAIWDMPRLFILPCVSFAIVGGLIAAWLYLTLWIESSGKLVSKYNDNFVYEKDGVAQVARWWNLLTLFWLVQFVMACQHLVVAGAVGDWYFSKHLAVKLPKRGTTAAQSLEVCTTGMSLLTAWTDKPLLERRIWHKVTIRQPVYRSLKRTIRYHLGTAVFGATLVAPLHIARVAFLQVFRWLNPKIPTPLIDMFINSNAYIEVALTGCNFTEGGQRAMRLITKFASDVADINSAGDFLLFMAKIAVMLSTMLVAIAIIQDKEGVMHVWVPVILATIFGYTVAHIFITVYEMAIDTIFICFCEDCENNDGVQRPYFVPSKSTHHCMSGNCELNAHCADRLPGPVYNSHAKRIRCGKKNKVQRPFSVPTKRLHQLIQVNCELNARSPARLPDPACNAIATRIQCEKNNGVKRPFFIFNQRKQDCMPVNCGMNSRLSDHLPVPGCNSIGTRIQCKNNNGVIPRPFFISTKRPHHCMQVNCKLNDLCPDRLPVPVCNFNATRIQSACILRTRPDRLLVPACNANKMRIHSACKLNARVFDRMPVPVCGTNATRTQCENNNGVKRPFFFSTKRTHQCMRVNCKLNDRCPDRLPVPACNANAMRIQYGQPIPRRSGQLPVLAMRGSFNFLVHSRSNSAPSHALRQPALPRIIECPPVICKQ